MAKWEELKRAAVNMLRVNMNFKAGEKAAFVTDVAAPEDWQDVSFDLLAEMYERALMTKRVFEMVPEEFPGNQIDFITYRMTNQHGTEPPDWLAAKFLKYDVLVIMNTFSLSHTNAREMACKAGIRVASMPGIEAEMFMPGGPMAADYERVAVETEKWAAQITAGNDVHILTPFGTDLHFSINGRVGGVDAGLIHNRGDFGNLPGGEAYTAPVEGTAEGKLVVPSGWYPGLKKDMTLFFENGLVTKVTGGGAVGEFFVQTFDFADESKKHRRNCAELGIGTNPNAKKIDNVLEAEKILGTIHVAVGDSSHLGGINESDLHEDFVLTQPTLIIDGHKLMG